MPATCTDRSAPALRLLHPLSRLAAVTALTLTPALSQAEDLAGSGSTFVYPVMLMWAAHYHDKTGAKVSYQGIGSGGGISQVKAGLVSFGASDKPLAPEELRKAGLVQFPLVVGGVVPVVNVDVAKPGAMKFTGAVLADIYLGKITRWNDPQIAALNPDLVLPDQKIEVVHRSDGSGTTFNWVNYLSKSSDEWKARIGDGVSVAWPVGTGGNGNEGVANNVNYMPGAIGYVELSYALKHKMKFAEVRNKDGAWVDPSAASFAAAAASADWTADDFYQVITDAPGAGSWPISATTFVLMPRVTADTAKSREALNFFKWSLESGQDSARKLDFVPLPKPLVEQIEAYWAKNLGAP